MIQSFFILCSGADPDILNKCSKGEQNKYAGIGATVFFTAVMAFIACSYALFTVFDNVYAAIFFGLIWGLLIFNLDRFIVSTLKKRKSSKQEIGQAVPRIILAIIIAIVISKPLEMKIFEKEINQVLLEQKNEMTLANQQQLALQYSPKVENLKQQIANLKTETNTQEAVTNDLYNTYITEAEGTAGTKLLGKGPVYEEKRQKHDASLQELQQLKDSNREKIAALEMQITNANTSLNSAVKSAQPIINNFDGLMARITALKQLPWLPSFFIFLLFLAIETSPIIAKLLASKSEYDYRLEEQESEIKSTITQNLDQREKHVHTDATINTKVYDNIKNENEMYSYKKEKAEQLLKHQAITFTNKQIGKQ